MKKTKDTWVLKRLVHDQLMQPKVKKKIIVNGEESIEDIGDYENDTLPDVVDEISTVWDISKKMWAFNGSDTELNEFVKKFNLYNKEGDKISTANRSLYGDSFFTHKEFKKNPLYMEGGIFTFPNDLKGEFLRKCWQGWSRVLLHGEESKLTKPELKEKNYLLIRSTELEEVGLQDMNKTLHASSIVYEMSKDVKILMGLILNLINNKNVKDLVITNKLSNAANSTRRMRNNKTTKLYGKRTEQDMIIEYGEKDLKELHTAVVVTKAINANILVYTKNGYELERELLKEEMFDFDEIVQYFMENRDIYNKLSDKIKY